VREGLSRGGVWGFWKASGGVQVRLPNIGEMGKTPFFLGRHLMLSFGQA